MSTASSTLSSSQWISTQRRCDSRGSSRTRRSGGTFEVGEHQDAERLGGGAPPIYSYPFVLWLLPWSAIALTEGRARLSYLGFGVVALTAFIYATLGGELVREASSEIQFLLLLRNAATGAIPIVYLVGRSWRRSVDKQGSSTAVLLGSAPARRAADVRAG